MNSYEMLEAGNASRGRCDACGETRPRYHLWRYEPGVSTALGETLDVCRNCIVEAVFVTQRAVTHA